MGNASKNSSFFKIPSCCSKVWRRRRRRRRRGLRENAIQQQLRTKLEPAQFLCRLVTSSRAESPEHYVPTDDSSQRGNEVPPELNIYWTVPSESSKATELSNKMGWYHTAELESLARLKASSSSPTKNKIKILLTTTPAKLSQSLCQNLAPQEARKKTATTASTSPNASASSRSKTPHTTNSSLLLLLLQHMGIPKRNRPGKATTNRRHHAAALYDCRILPHTDKTPKTNPKNKKREREKKEKKKKISQN